MSYAHPDDTRAVRFPAYRSYLEVRTLANDNFMALLAGSEIAREALAAADPNALLPQAFPLAVTAPRMNQPVAQVDRLLADASTVIARVAIPQVLTVYAVYLSDSINLLRDLGLDEDPHDPEETHLRVLHSRIEGSTEGTLPKADIELFELLRVVRNRLEHQGGTPGSKLDPRWKQASAEAKAEWCRLAQRPFSDVIPRPATKPMQLGLGELIATLAITHRLAHRVNAILVEHVAEDVWADTVVEDYGDLNRRKARDPNRSLRRVKGLARRWYQPLGLTDEALEEVLKRVAR